MLFTFVEAVPEFEDLLLRERRDHEDLQTLRSALRDCSLVPLLLVVVDEREGKVLRVLLLALRHYSIS